MKHLKYVHLFEAYSKSYKFLYEANPYEDDLIEHLYRFTTKDGIDMLVLFYPTEPEGAYVREFGAGTDSQEDFSVDELGTYDAGAILRTVTDATLDFISRVRPDTIQIVHVNTRLEDDLSVEVSPNRRARVNRMFLELVTPSDYSYELQGNTTYITKHIK